MSVARRMTADDRARFVSVVGVASFGGMLSVSSPALGTPDVAKSAHQYPCSSSYPASGMMIGGAHLDNRKAIVSHSFGPSHRQLCKQ